MQIHKLFKARQTELNLTLDSLPLEPYPVWAAAIGLDLMPVDGKSSIEMKKAISQLTSSSALSTMQTLKDNSKQGATGLGQVAVKEFEALMDKASSIDQYLQSGDLEDAVNLYVYDRNKLAYINLRING